MLHCIYTKRRESGRKVTMVLRGDDVGYDDFLFFLTSVANNFRFYTIGFDSCVLTRPDAKENLCLKELLPK